MQKPKNSLFIPYGRQWITNEDIQAVADALESDYLTQGPLVPRYEKNIADYCGVRFAVAFSSGTAALHAACFAAGITKGDEVITSPMTFTASANCVLYSGGTPIFADIRSDLPIINSKEIEKKITIKTRAIIPVDYSGLPADYDEINALAKEHNLLVIGDAAHSLGATYKGRNVGKLADMTVFSFHPVKLITTGEGGMVVTDNPEFFERLILFQTHGITKDKTKYINKSDGGWYHEMQILGYNYRLTEIQAALGLSQFKRITSFLKRRTEIAEQYIKAFRDMSEISSIEVPTDRKSVWHIFPILLENKSKRKQLYDRLRRQNIFTQVHYIPIHLHPFYKANYGYRIGNFPNAENYYNAELSMPIFPKLTNSEQNFVLRKLTECLD